MGWFSKINSFTPWGATLNYLEREAGPNGNDPGNEANGRYFTQSPYDQGVWDENGNPLRLPSQDNPYIFSWQYEANRRAEQRRSMLWNDAQGALTQGANLLQSYRPGGSAALASGIYAQRANLYGMQAQTIEAPDVLMDWRRHQQHEANVESRRAARLSMGLQAANTVIGAVGAATAPGAPAAAPIAGAGGQAAPGGVPTGQSALTPGGGPSNLTPSTVGGPSVAPSMLQGPGVLSAPGAGGGGTGQARLPGGGGAGGGAGPVGPAGEASAGAAAAFPGGGGLGQDGNFSPSAAAASAARSAHPVVADAVTQEWANDPVRRSSTNALVMASRQRLMAAIKV